MLSFESDRYAKVPESTKYYDIPEKEMKWNFEYEN